MTKRTHYETYQPELRTRAAKLYHEHRTLAKVAKVMGLSRQRISVLLKDAGVKVMSPGNPKFKKKRRRKGKAHAPKRARK